VNFLTVPFVLHSQWDHSFRLYRLHENETFDFDYSKANSKVRAKALLDECPWQSSLCKPCFDPTRAVQEVDTATIFREHGWYASFAKISDDAVQQLWDMMLFPFDVTTTVLEHAFISNLKNPMVTAGLHANPSTSSMAVQVQYLIYIYFQCLHFIFHNYFLSFFFVLSHVVVCGAQDMAFFLF
jgi:hypothetical protein